VEIISNWALAAVSSKKKSLAGAFGKYVIADSGFCAFANSRNGRRKHHDQNKVVLCIGVIVV
jgi:hypothetical protein